MRLGRSPSNAGILRAAGPGRRLWLRAGLCLGAAMLAVAALTLGFAGAFLNGYGKRRLERAYAAEHPGCVLRIGALAYALDANRLVAETVSLHSPGSDLAVDRAELAGVRWARLFLGRAAPAEVFAKASLEASGLGAAFTHAPYRISTKRLRASVAGSELSAEGIEFWPTLHDEALFSRDAFRMTRYHVVIPECRILGAAFTAWIQTGAFRAREVRLLRPSFDLLADRDKPVRPSQARPLMVDEALAAIRPPLQVDRFSVTDGSLTYAERVLAGAPPGMLTFSALNLRADDITNRGGPTAAIRLQARCRLMDAGQLQVQMAIPLAGAALSLRYSGTLGAMDLTRLDAFLDRAEHLKIKSGRVNEVAFRVEVSAGQARGQVRGSYRDLKMAVLDPPTGTEKRMASFKMNTFRLRHDNPGASGAEKEGVVDYRRKRTDTFIQVVWFSLRSGVVDLIK